MNEKTVKLPAGTTIKMGGIPVTLTEDTNVSTHPNNWPLIREWYRDNLDTELPDME